MHTRQKCKQKTVLNEFVSGDMMFLFSSFDLNDLVAFERFSLLNANSLPVLCRSQSTKV